MSIFYQESGRLATMVVLGFFLPGMLAAGEPGKMTREVWTGLPVGSIMDFTESTSYWQAATMVSSFTGAAVPKDLRVSYASRIRAWITAPVTGNYTFWIASDGESQLWLSPTDSKFGRVKIASLTGGVAPEAWDARTSQKSSPVHLIAGQCYFIETLSKEQFWDEQDILDDHLSIAWQIPGGTREEIPASALESFTADANDVDNDELPDDWETAHGFSSLDNGTLYPDQHPFADPDHDGFSNFEESTLGMAPLVRGGLAGSLLLETWYNLDSTNLEYLTFSSRFTARPDLSEFVFSAETPANRADNFGARLRGFIIAPITGSYLFQLSGDDNCQLWLSPSESQFGKQLIASVNGWTNVREWNKYPSQISTAIPLVAGKKYYIEALVKEGGGGDHLEIGWKLPDSSTTVVIPGSALESYIYDAQDIDGDNMPSAWETAYGLDPTVNEAALDFDGDGISNSLEYANGTDPTVKNTIAGALLQEIWWNVSGDHVRDLISSSRFLQNPDLTNLVTSTYRRAAIADNYGSRLRGYLTPPVSGNYTFWAAGDESLEFWLSPSANPRDRKLLISPAIVTRDYDADLSMKSRTLPLIAGQKYYIEILQKDGHGDDFYGVLWQRTGGPREVIPGSALSSFIPTADDQDDDGLPDAWEITNGLSPHDNGSIDPRNGAQGDLDSDGLSNAAEWQVGTRADVVDTDSDGVNDRDEVELMESQALMADAAPFQSVSVIPGSSYTAVSGSWISESGKARQDCVRGWLEYPVSLAAAGVYQLDLAFTPVTDTGVSQDYEIVFSADGKTIQREIITVAEAASGHAKVLSPWLAAGSHTFRVFIDNSYWYRRITVDQLEILAARGPDANGNGTPDWIDLRLATYNSIEAPAESLTSPVCLEGKAKWSELTTVNETTVQPAPNDRWYADVPLDATQPTEVTASLENGGLTATRQITWLPTNLLTIGTLSLRLGDSLKLTAFTGMAGTPEETVSITLEGRTTTITADQPLVHTFTTAGSIPIQLTHSLDGNLTTTTASINVVAAPVIESPVCVVGYYREVSIPALQSGVTLQLDNRIEVRDTSIGTVNTISLTLRLNTLEDRPFIFRLGGPSGPVLASLSFKTMRLRSGRETAVFVAGVLDDNTLLVDMPVIADGIYLGVCLNFEILIGGVVFEDGSISKIITLSDCIDNSGQMKIRFLKSGILGSNCYTVKITHDGVRIGFRQ